LKLKLPPPLQGRFEFLVVGSPWEVKGVDLKLEEKKLKIELGWQ